jgi:nitric oxide reductase subunit B
MSYMEVQDQLSIFYWMRFGSGVVVVIGVLMWVYAILGPRSETRTAPQGAWSPAE